MINSNSDPTCGYHQLLWVESGTGEPYLNLKCLDLRTKATNLGELRKKHT